jgi:beta-phosphoglucomutase
MCASRNGGDPRRVLILDFDGVVVDTEWVHFESWNAAFAEILDVQLPGDYTQIVGLTLDELHRMWTASGVISAATLDSRMKERLLARKTELFFEIGADRLTPIPGIGDLVHRAQALGWYAAIASRGRRMRLLRTLELAHVPAVFELVLGSADIVDAATDRKVHARAAEMLGADPADCMVIEDSAAGIADACASGIGWVVGLTTSAGRAELYGSGADQVVESLDDVDIPPPARK